MRCGELWGQVRVGLSLVGPCERGVVPRLARGSGISGACLELRNNAVAIGYVVKDGSTRRNELLVTNYIRTLWCCIVVEILSTRLIWVKRFERACC